MFDESSEFEFVIVIEFEFEFEFEFVIEFEFEFAVASLISIVASLIFSSTFCTLCCFLTLLLGGSSVSFVFAFALLSLIVGVVDSVVDVEFAAMARPLAA